MQSKWVPNTVRTISCMEWVLVLKISHTLLIKNNYLTGGSASSPPVQTTGYWQQNSGYFRTTIRQAGCGWYCVSVPIISRRKVETGTYICTLFNEPWPFSTTTQSIPRSGELAVLFPPRILKKPRPNEERIFLVPKLSFPPGLEWVGDTTGELLFLSAFSPGSALKIRDCCQD